MAPQAYLRKMTGTTSSPPRVGLREILWSWIGAFLGMSVVAVPHFGWLGGTDLVMIIGSFGASAVLAYGAIRSPLAQPRNLVGGHVISAVIGVASYQILGYWPWLAAAVAVASAIAQEVASHVASDDVPKYLAATLRAYREQADPDERLAKTITRVGFETFKESIENHLDSPYEDLAREANEAREIAEAHQCIGPLGQ